MEFIENEKLRLAYGFVENTNRNIFLTGKAGTGKTTFLHNFRKTTPKRMVIVAPTGVAAINAGGVTMHSFFQLPFGPHLPGAEYNQEPAAKKFSREKIRLMQSLDLLVIDEISMVRADMLDAVDGVLRRYRSHQKPFGGVQLLMIGDLHQLSPVVKENEWELLKEYYSTLFFFGSRALAETNFISIELDYIFRQTDSGFISLLNQVRENQMDEHCLRKLNERYIPNFSYSDDDGYILLTTHNAGAQQINNERLAGINEKSHVFRAEVEGDFPAFTYPTDHELELKTGSQVMFVKNDSSRDKLFYNGKIGKIIGFEDDEIRVKCPGDLHEIVVKPVKWENLRFSLDEKTREVKEEIIGTFSQIPLKLAWAITIHKSQGLTFERAIIDAQAAFAAGQVYVALSRCKSFEGLVLRTPIPGRAIKTDFSVYGFSQEVRNNQPDDAELEIARQKFRNELILDLFDFNSLKNKLIYAKKVFINAGNSLVSEFVTEINKIESSFNSDIVEVSDKFRRQLQFLMSRPDESNDDTEVDERLKKACQWFTEKLESTLNPCLAGIRIETDNKALEKTAMEALSGLRRELFIKLAVLRSSSGDFNTLSCLQARANAELDFQEKPIKETLKKVAPPNTSHPEFYIWLKDWRNEKASELDIEPYLVLPQKTLMEIAKMLPRNKKALGSIKGIGKAKLRVFGDEILHIIEEYCERKGIVEH
jgi:hypothetical protein